MADLQARITQLEAELAAAQREMQDFSYAVSHDLRAPLRHIVSYAQLLQEDAAAQLDDEARGFLDTISGSARHMGVLLDALLEQSRIGTAPLQLGAVPLQPLVQEVCTEVQALHAGRQISCSVEMAALEVQADAALLRQSLRLVLDNAWKFTAHQAQPRVAITAAADAQGRVQITVQDNGAGYNPALQAQLFKMFSRLHSPKQFPGLGTGLALTRKAMARMGGSVEISGAVDAGCTVTLSLPGGPWTD